MLISSVLYLIIEISDYLDGYLHWCFNFYVLLTRKVEFIFEFRLLLVFLKEYGINTNA